MTAESIADTIDLSNRAPAKLMSSMDAATIIDVALTAGADSAGVTGADPLVESRRRLELADQAGLRGRLHFTYQEPKKSTDVSQTFPWAKSVIVVGRSYVPDAPVPGECGAVVARFATQDHYEPVRSILNKVAAVIREAGGKAELLVDDNALVDRGVAIKAGIGWLGRSTMLLSPGFGPWTLLGSVITDLELRVTAPMTRTCGTCYACVPACPTLAITPVGIDAERCIAAWLQSPGSIPLWIRPYVERRIYGCDDCLEACPPGHPLIDVTKAPTQDLPFHELLVLSDDELLGRFTNWYVPHREARHIRRNLLVAAGNSAESSARPHIVDHFQHASALVRGHAYWALARSLGPEAWTPLRERYASETVPAAIRELDNALAMLRR